MKTETMDKIVNFAATALISFSIGLWVVDNDYQRTYGLKEIKAECEATLPNNMTCEIIVTAKPKGE